MSKIPTFDLIVSDHSGSPLSEMPTLPRFGHGHWSQGTQTLHYMPMPANIDEVFGRVMDALRDGKESITLDLGPPQEHGETWRDWLTRLKAWRAEGEG